MTLLTLLMHTEPCWCRGRGRRKRSAEEDSQDRAFLADLVQKQDAMHNNNGSLRARRSALPLVDRNIIFAVDASGSIRRDYPRALELLGTFSYLFCGYISVGMVTFSTHIELELCPTCLRNTDEATHRQGIFNRITSARYHGGQTSTGETVKCLADHILPSPDCRILNKPTQVVFFTDGKHNGCLNTRKQMEDLVQKYPTLETYVIGMGRSILASGVADLQGPNSDPSNFFSVRDLGELQQLMDAVLIHIYNGDIACVPHAG